MSPKVPKIVLAHTQFKGFMPGKIHSMDNKFKERDIAPALKVTFVGPTLGLPGALNGTVRATYGSNKRSCVDRYAIAAAW